MKEIIEEYKKGKRKGMKKKKKSKQGIKYVKTLEKKLMLSNKNVSVGMAALQGFKDFMANESK